MRPRVIAAAIALVLVVAAVVWLVSRTQEPAVVPTPSPTAVTTSPTEPSTPAAPTPSTQAASTPARYAECDPLDAEGFVPESFRMENPEADEPVLSLGLDAEGNIAAPPVDQPRTASWWNQGPRAGSEAGKVVMSIHTYRNGGALGNEMYTDAGPSLTAGDLVMLEDAEGRTACYEFVEASKIWVDEYDPASDVMVDFEGDPMLTIVICWDFDGGTEIWDSRILFYAKPVTL